jgi:glyoxylase-like metal-dependent hydrolase (beta-lactamase superfamily II)
MTGLRAATTATEVAPGVHAVAAPFEGVPLTVYLVEGEEGTAVIDTGVARTPADHLLPALAGAGWTLDKILHTHAHHDHVGGDAAVVAAFPGIRVLAPRGEISWVEDPEGYLQLYREIPWPAPQEHVPRVRRLRGAGVPVDRALDGGEVVELGGERRLTVLPTPGHSRDHVAFHDLDAGVIFTGDALTGRGTRVPYGRMFPLYHDVELQLASLEAIRQAGAELACTAHDGPLAGARLTAALDESERFVEQLDELVLRRPASLAATVSAVIECWPEYRPSFAAHTTVAAHLRRHDPDREGN